MGIYNVIKTCGCYERVTTIDKEWDHYTLRKCWWHRLTSFLYSLSLYLGIPFRRFYVVAKGNTE